MTVPTLDQYPRQHQYISGERRQQQERVVGICCRQNSIFESYFLQIIKKWNIELFLILSFNVHRAKFHEYATTLDQYPRQR